MTQIEEEWLNSVLNTLILLISIEIGEEIIRVKRHQAIDGLLHTKKEVL